MATKAKRSSYEGLQENIRTFKTPLIETWKNQYPDRDYTVNLEIPEFTCLCPKTGLPDFATIHISYIPDKRCVELKSFKSYIFSYRNRGIFHEHAVNRILDDFVKASQPRWVKVSGEFNIRGGIKTTVCVEYKKR
jgi:7-cyano-7-deazaguanine reductase